MIIDLHVHTRVLSPCSNIDPESAIIEAKKIGLDGLCFTEHEKMWKAEDLDILSKKWNFPLFRAVEVEIRDGHILVFGLENNNCERLLVIRGLNELCQIVRFAGGIMIAAHPFRKVLVGFGNLPEMLEDVCKKTVFQKVDAIEIFNGRSKNEEIKLAQLVSKKLGVAGTGGSDAHTLQEIGRCVTVFENNVRNEAELVTELKRGHFQAKYFRI